MMNPSHYESISVTWANAQIANIKQMFAIKSLTNTAVVCIATVYFEHAERFHISCFTNHLRHFIIIDHK